MSESTCMFKISSLVTFCTVQRNTNLAQIIPLILSPHVGGAKLESQAYSSPVTWGSVTTAPLTHR